MTRQLLLDLPTANSYARDDFIVSEGNRAAFNHLAQFPDWTSNLCLIQGPAQSGKTHLANIFQVRSGGILLDAAVMDDAAFSSQSLAKEDAALVIDNFDDGQVSEDVLFHTVNACMRSGRPLVMFARRGVSEWPFVTNDLKSRGRLALSFTLAEPDDGQLTQMFVKLLADRQLSADLKIVDYLVARMERSAAEVVALVQLLDELSLSQSRAITRNLAAQALNLRAEGEVEA